MTQLAVDFSQKVGVKTRNQTTLKKEVSFSGVGIHTGHEVNLKLCPAEKGTGIVFQRVDLSSKPFIPATVEYVQDTARCTTIGIGDVKVHTVEHVMAALYTAGIDNVIVQVDGPEPPVGDGSSSVFVKMIESAQTEQLSSLCPVLKLTEPLYFSQDSVHIVALPADHYQISYTLHYPQIKSIGSQYHSLIVTKESFAQEIASCRTFALYKELKVLMDLGLIRGGSLDNAVVVHDDAIFSKEGLKFPNEMGRHKILDLIGDMALVGFSFEAHLISICSGHTTNVAFAKKMLNHLTMEKI